MDEPSMLIQRPSSSHSQETSHILLSTFRDLLNNDGLNEDRIKNLSTSKSGENVYHDKYVEKLQAIHNKWSSKISAIDGMISHLDKAKAQARSLEKEEEENAVEEYLFYKDLGLPSVPSRLNRFLDQELLQDNNLVVPHTFLEYKVDSSVNKVSNPSIPQYASSTFSSRQMFEEIPSLGDYLPDPAPILPRNSKVNKENTRTMHTRKSQAKSSKSEKNVWRHCITPKQREEEKKEIIKLQKRADFLKNPRFSSNTRSLVRNSKLYIIESEWNYHFEPYPFPVIFNDYKVGETYQLKLELKNVTAASRQLRVLEPKSQFFTVTIGEFPSEKGLVAPGMSCTYTVTFTPQTLEDYNDYIEVKTQGMEPLLIPLQGRRKPPRLSLPILMDCGYCLVGSMKVNEFTVHNDGGKGRFHISLKHENDKHPSKILWDELDYGNEELSVLTDIFTISPKCFSLLEGESTNIKVLFSPSAIKQFNISIILSCDNCAHQEYEIKGFGEVADIELVSVDGGLSQPDLHETQDPSATGVIRFGDAYPGKTYTKQLKVRNKVSVPISYCWDIIFPSTTPNHDEDSKKDTNKSDESSVFKIQPAGGILEERSIQIFHIVFSPDRIGDWYKVLCMRLKNIPILKDELFVECDPLMLKYNLKGESQPFRVSAQPSALYMSGKHFYGLPYFRTVKLMNKSSQLTSYKWQNFDSEDLKITFHPNNGEIGANSSAEFLAEILGKKAGKFDVQIPYLIPFSSHCDSIYLHAIFVGPSVCFDETDVTFGLIKLGDVIEKEITLRNQSPTEAKWNLFCCQNEYDANLVSITPCKGVLEANKWQAIRLKFQPNQTMTFNGYLSCHVIGSKPCHLPLFAEVQRPHVYLQSSNIDIETAFIDIPLTTKVTLCNSGWLPAKCCFLENKDNNFEIEPKIKEFQLGSHEKMEIDIAVVFHQLGPLEGLFALKVDDMLELVVFSLSVNVQGLTVDVSVPNVDDIESQSETIRTNDVIDFGPNVLLGQFNELILIIENQSAVPTHFKLWFEEFQCASLPTPLESQQDVTTRSKRSSRLLSKSETNHRMKSNSQIKRELSEAALRDGRGLALICTPSEGSLDAYERKMIVVTCQSDMWGDYNDMLHCCIGESIEKIIPTHVGVIGSPLNFQMAKDQPLIVRFGTHSAGAKCIQRSLRINNTSYVDIRLDWKTFVIHPNDQQLIDMNCYFGTPFPLLNKDGDEVVEEQSFIETDAKEELVKVVLKEHQGVERSEPFEIINKQMIVPAQSPASLELCFTPPAYLTAENTYRGYALGYMSLESNDRRAESGCFIRADGLDMLPFGLSMTACVVPPKILLESCEDEEFKFELNASEFNTKKQISCSRRYLCTNRSGTAVSFRCNIQPPFRMTVTNEKLPSNVIQGNSVNKYTLKPNQNMEIRAVLDLTRELVESNHDSKKFMIVEGNLTIEHEDKHSQMYSLIGLINYPSLTIQKNEVDFGTCFVGEKREKILHISNDSKDLLRWKIEMDQAYPSSVRDVFEVKTTNGEIGFSATGEVSREIVISFVAKHNVEYECVLYVSSIFHEKYLKPSKHAVCLRGKGSYDEADQVKLIG